MKPQNPFDPKRFKVIPVTNDLVRQMIIDNHYKHTWPVNCQNSFGVVWDNSRLVGALIFGEPSRNELSKSISPLVKRNEVTELKRVWIKDGLIEDGYGTNMESWSISISFKMLPQEKFVVVSYADPSQYDPKGNGHIGKIYQALNGLYQIIPNTYVYYQINLNDPNDPKEWIHSRSQQWKYGRHSMEELKWKIGKPFWRRKDTKKYRYLWFLCGKTKKKQLIESLYYPPSPYPKKSCPKQEWELVE